MKSFEQILSEGLYDPNIFKAFFLAGGPGSGKSFVARNVFAGTGLKLVNSDIILENSLRKSNLSMSMPDEEQYFRDILRTRAKAIVDNQIDLYVKGRLGLVIDATGRDYFNRKDGSNLKAPVTKKPSELKKVVKHIIDVSHSVLVCLVIQAQ